MAFNGFTLKNFQCKHCMSNRFYAEPLQNTTNTVGLYCYFCGTWYKWLNKSEKKLISRKAGDSNG